jgi:protein SCO1/2
VSSVAPVSRSDSALRSRSIELGRSTGLILVTVLCVACGAAARAEHHPQAPLFRGKPTLRAGVAADFVLTDQRGRLVRLSAQRGRAVLITFLYTSCPDVCPLTAAKLGLVARQLGPLAKRLSILAVSVDPENDTPSNVRRFVAKFHLPPQFHYLMGTSKQLQPVWQSYNVLVERRNLERIDHGIPIVAIDPAGRPRVYFSHSAPPSSIAHDVRLLLKRP